MTKNLRTTNSKFIDQSTRISFKFDGKKLYGFKGDTLASALLANKAGLTVVMNKCPKKILED